MKTLVVELHSLTKDYISKEKTPFLYGLKEKYDLARLVPPFGHVPLASFWTGCYPNRHKIFADYIYQGNKLSPLKYFPDFAANIYFNFNRLLRKEYYLRKLAANKLSGYFRIKRKRHYFQKRAFEIPTLFDIFRDNGKKFIYYEHPILAKNERFRIVFPFKKSNKERLEYFVKNCLEPKYDFYFIQLRDIDLTGHKYGPCSREMELCLKELDMFISHFLSKFDFTSDNIIVTSGFGTVAVKKYIDLGKQLPKFGKGYVYFLDSTTARFWFFNKTKKEEVLKILSGIKEGHVLSEEEKIKFKIDCSNNEFGDEIFLVDYGTGIIPNFYNKDPIKSVHMYDRSHEDEFGIFIVNRPVGNRAEVIDIAPTILDMMDINYSKEQFDGKSLLIR